MEKVEILKNIDKNLNDLNLVENQISMVLLAIYEKKVEKVKQEKINEVREYFAKQLKIYNQKHEKFNLRIDQNVKIFTDQIEKIITVYDSLYVNIFKTMQKAMNNQKLVLANIITLESKEVNSKENEDKKKKLQIANAQKKINYSVIIEECQARINWIIENVQNDIQEIFKVEVMQLEVFKENILSKLKRLIFNNLSRKNRYKQFLNNFKNTNIKEIKSKVNFRSLELAEILGGFIKQIEIVESQINNIYDEQIK